MPCNVIHYLATADEAALLEDIEDLGYGEIYRVNHIPGIANTDVEISEKTRNFLIALKTIGFVQKVTVHDSEPTLIEYRLKTIRAKYQALKKMKM